MTARLAQDAPVVLVDMDGPQVHWEPGLQSRLAALHPDIPWPTLRTGFHVTDDFAPEHIDIVHEIMRSEGFYLELERVDGSIQAMQEMLAEGIEVFICTAPHLYSPTCASEKIASIQRDLGWEWGQRTIITRDKTLVYGDVLIDDRPDIYGAIQPMWTHVVWDAPYNQTMDTGFRLKQWADWRTVVGAAIDNRRAAA